MPPQLSSNVKEKTADSWHSALSGHLHPGEVVEAFAKTNSTRPLMNAIAVTNARIVVFQANGVARQGPKVEIGADEIASVKLVQKMSGRAVVVTTHDRGEVSLGVIQNAEIDFVWRFVHKLAAAGYPEEVRAGLHAQTDAPLEEEDEETLASEAALTGVSGFNHGSKLSERKVRNWVWKWSPLLSPSEHIRLIAWCTGPKLRDSLVITDSRVMCGSTATIVPKGAHVEARLSDILGVEMKPLSRYDARHVLQIRTRNIRELDWRQGFSIGRRSRG